MANKNMKIHLTERMIQQRASAQSYAKGVEYYQDGAIFNPAWQDTPQGNVLMGQCEGSSGAAYAISITLDANGINNAACTCPYDWGGDCKHIIALLLTYLHDPEEFVQRKNLTELLEGVDRDGLFMLLNRLVENNPGLYDNIAVILPVIKVKPPTQPGVAAIKISSTSVSEPTYRKQVKRILKQSYSEETYDSEWSPPDYLNDLEQMQATAEQLLADGDAEGAVIILRVLLEETSEAYDSDRDDQGYVAGFIRDLGSLLAEAILSTTMGNAARQKMLSWADEILANID